MAQLEHIFRAMLAGSWRAAILVALLCALRWLVGKYLSRQVLALFWVGIALVALAPFAVVPAGWSPFNYTRVASVSHPRSAPVEPVVLPAAETRAVVAAPAETVRLVVLEQPVHLEQRDFTRAGVLWLAGAGFMLLWQFAAVWNLRRHLRRLVPSDDPRLLGALAGARRELGLTSTLPVHVTDLVATPALCGIWRPRLLFPPGFAEGLSDAELRFVMLHELGHWRRRDLWLLTLLQVTRAVHWFNPALWLALRFARQDCELACDEFVLRHSGGDRGAAYGETLLKVLGRVRRPAPLPGGVGIVENKRQLLKRFAMIMNYHPIGFLRAVCGVVLLGAFTVVGATQEKAAPAVPASPPATPAAPTPGEMAQRRQEMLAKALEWEARVKLELRAVGEVGGVPVALIDVEGEPQMMIMSSGIMGLRIAAIDVAAQTATVANRAGENRVLSLTNPREIAWPKVEAKWFLTPEALARRRENLGREIMPSAVVLAWAKINREGKEEILLNYLRSAQVVGITPNSEGISMTMGFLFEVQEQQLRRERREKFVASLTPEQRADFNNGAQPAIRFTDPPEAREKQAAKAKDAKERMDKVIAGLTPEQKALYENYAGPAPSRTMGR